MDFLRSIVDNGYSLLKPLVFLATKKDPQVAHEWFVSFSKFIDRMGLDERLLGFSNRDKKLSFEISNAAGFNKNGEIPHGVLYHLGFDRNVVGTVTGDPWHGNPRPTIERHIKTKSLVNWQGLPGIGAEGVTYNFRKHSLDNSSFLEMPTTINFMGTPYEKDGEVLKKEGDELLEDLQKTIVYTHSISRVDRFEYNGSCPNVRESSTKDYDSHIRGLEEQIKFVRKTVPEGIECDFKISPNATLPYIEDTSALVEQYGFSGIVATNTNPNPDSRFIPKSAHKGGASGDAVYESSLNTQKAYNTLREKNGYSWKIRACGGIRSLERMNERINSGADGGIQIFTPLIFEGPRLLRELRSYEQE